MSASAADEGRNVSDRNQYDPFASPDAQPGMGEPSRDGQAPSGQPGMSEPSHYGPTPSTQPGMGDVAPMPGQGYAYGTGSAYGYGAPSPYRGATPANSSQKNYLGVLSLVFPFVSLALVGIIMGHLGLSAVKKGTANNRGVALAGTIVSWVFTVVGGPILLAAIALPLYASQQDKAYEAEAKSDLLNIRVAVAGHLVDHLDAPMVSIDGDHYSVGDQTVPKSQSIEDVELVMLDGGEFDIDFCVAVTYDGGKELSLSVSTRFVEGPCPEATGSPDLVSGDGSDDDAVAPEPTGGTTEADVVPFTDLAVGDCIADPYDNLMEDPSGGTWITGVTIVDCAEEHYGEIYAEFDVSADAYVEDDIYDQADQLCYDAYEAFMGIGYADSVYY